MVEVKKKKDGKEEKRRTAGGRGLYGCGKKRAKEVCGAGGRRGKTKVGRVKKELSEQREPC